MGAAPPKRVRLVVGPREAPITLEVLLTTRGGLSSDVFTKALAAGGVTVNRRRAVRADHPLAVRDEVVAHLAERGEAARGARALDADRILLLDEQVVAIDKPAGLAAQGTQVDQDAGLDAAVAEFLRRRGERNASVGLVHRLDVGTSGVTVFGRTAEAVRHLADQFREGAVEKRYRALVAGIPSPELVADGPIGADAAHPGSYTISPHGRPAWTRFVRLADFEGNGLSAALVEARPKTGRTHQIRVHAAHLGHPLLGDRRYGGPALLTAKDGTRILAPRVALHAAELSFDHPAKGRMTLHAPWPADLAALESALTRAARA